MWPKIILAMIAATLGTLTTARSQDSPAQTITFAMSRSIVPDERVQSVTNNFCKELAREVGGIQITSLIPDCSLNEYGKKLDEGEEFQAGAMWGIEYGWLATRHPKLEILVTGSGRGAGDIGVTSHLVVNKELTTRGGAGSLLSHYSSQNPFRLARHRQESLVTQIHKNELIRGYGKGVFQDSETTSERILDALAAVRNGQYDGVLVDEYRLFGLEQQYDLRKRFSIIGDWGASKDRISLPLFVVVGVRENINRGKSGQWEKIQAAIVAKVKRDDEVTRRMLGEWQANTLVLPTEKFIANCHLAAKKYQMSELGQ